MLFPVCIATKTLGFSMAISAQRLPIDQSPRSRIKGHAIHPSRSDSTNLVATTPHGSSFFKYFALRRANDGRLSTCCASGRSLQYFRSTSRCNKRSLPVSVAIAWWNAHGSLGRGTFLQSPRDSEYCEFRFNIQVCSSVLRVLSIARQGKWLKPLSRISM